MVRFWIVAGAILAQASATAHADTAPARADGGAGLPEMARAFGARELIQQISLSPDGTRVAIVTPDGPRGSALVIADPVAGTPSRTILKSTGTSEHLRSCRWAAATRLICQISVTSDATGERLSFSRMVALDSDGSAIKTLNTSSSGRELALMQNGGSVIDWQGGDNAVLITRSFIPEQSIGTRLAQSESGLGVDRLDTVTLSRRKVEPPRDSAVEYITDGRGKVRVMGLRPRTGTGREGDTISYLYRRTGSSDWLPLSKVTVGDGLATGFDPYAVDAALDAVYGFDQSDGRKALYRLSLDGSLKRELVLGNAAVDIDELIRIGRDRRVVGASFATDTRQSEFFDPELRALRAALGKALPKHPLVTFVDASADEKTLLLNASSDTDPGRYYLYLKPTRQLIEVLPSRPALSDVALGTMKAITYRAADGTMIPGYLTLPAGSDGKGLPAIVMPHGGPGARDEWGFDWWAQFFAVRGFAVLQPNFRGSTGYGAQWFQKNGFQSWRTAVGDVNDAGRWLTAQGIAAPGKLGIVGWSYGGYAALQSAVLDADLFKAIVAVAPVTDLDALRQEARGFTHYPQVDRFIGHGPHVQDGSPARNAKAIRAPALLFHGDIDDNVGVGESRLMARRLREAGRSVDYVEYRGLDHQLDDATARAEMLERSDAFLRKSLGL